MADPFKRTWCEVDAGDFRLITDRPREQAEELVRLLRRFRPVAERYLPGEPNLQDPPLAVIVFQRRGDFTRAIGGADMAAFMQPSFTENLMVVGPDTLAHVKNESLLHEYVHYLLRTRAGINIPTWFDEGLAGMLSSARVDDAQVVVGALPRELETSIRESRLALDAVLGAEDVWDWHQQRRQGFYAWSWVLVHRLMIGQSEEDAELRTGLAKFLAGERPTLGQALEVRTGLLQRRLERYLEGRVPTESHMLAAPPETATGYRCLDPPEAVERLSLAVGLHNPKLAERHLSRQLDAHPDNAHLWTALSLVHEASGRRDDAVAAARRAVALAPEDVSAAVRLAGALAMGCILDLSDECRARWQEAVPLLRQSLRRDPTRHDAIFTLGLAYLYSGRAGDALNYLRIAYQQQPWAPHVNFYLGESYRIIGDTRAREHLLRVRQWSPVELWRKMAEAALARLDAEG